MEQPLRISHQVRQSVFSDELSKQPIETVIRRFGYARDQLGIPCRALQRAPHTVTTHRDVRQHAEDQPLAVIGLRRVSRMNGKPSGNMLKELAIGRFVQKIRWQIPDRGVELTWRLRGHHHHLGVCGCELMQLPLSVVTDSMRVPHQPPPRQRVQA
jgi:hypothetical protein